MPDNDKPKEEKMIFEVKLIDKKIDIKISPDATFQLVSHAFRLLNLHIDNCLIAMEAKQKKPPIIQVPIDMATKLRKRIITGS